ncbi:GNAT family N-acetyltransferase [Hazenella sp. IB182353]|uniref:GNAT family N-acetyltransferase n=1 Tax=Polycladospora coralii TaxID=2771432 RepID=UPI001747486B|nr:GNAT family N-acetyltransferase [Polycladospora coralii]MBS7531142.1 GNAT family N-acetyltransferase [Polycladospora coralii]
MNSKLLKSSFKFRPRIREKDDPFIIQLLKKNITNYDGRFDDYNACVKNLNVCTDHLVLEGPSGKVIGYIGLIKNKESIFIKFAVMDERYQSKGIGSLFFKKLLVNLKKQGIRTIQLQVDIVNTRAISLYKKLGFKTVKQDFLKTVMEMNI